MALKWDKAERAVCAWPHPQSRSTCQASMPSIISLHTSSAGRAISMYQDLSGGQVCQDLRGSFCQYLNVPILLDWTLMCRQRCSSRPSQTGNSQPTMRVFPDDDDDDVYYSEGRRPREDELPCNWHVIDECWGVPCLQVKEHTGSAKDITRQS